jgi:hypothetical protein
MTDTICDEAARQNYRGACSVRELAPLCRKGLEATAAGPERSKTFPVYARRQFGVALVRPLPFVPLGVRPSSASAAPSRSKPIVEVGETQEAMSQSPRYLVLSRLDDRAELQGDCIDRRSIWSGHHNVNRFPSVFCMLGQIGFFLRFGIPDLGGL